MRLHFQNLVFLFAKNRYFVVIAFKKVMMEFKSKYTLLIMKLQTIFGQFILVKVEEKIYENLRLNFGKS